MNKKIPIRYRYLIIGQVQGVGFRPFVYKLALLFKLTGFIRNNGDGVEIEIQGTEDSVRLFEDALVLQKPDLASIYDIKISKLPISNKKKFEIIESQNINNKTVSILPDTKICNECINDIETKSKYYNYFSTNCTNCGVRYSIIKTVPYDRKNTSMSKFILCKSCHIDYENPNSRRYHAQPTSCNKCGPKLILDIKNQKNYIGDNIYQKIADLIKIGKIGALKGIGGFHIICDSTDDKVISKLRKYKNRPNKPFAIMCKDINQIKSFAKMTNKQQEVLNQKESPIVILDTNNSYNLSKLIAPNINKIGCMLPYTATYYLLFKYLKAPIIATSANLGGEPIITKKDDITQKLPFVDFVVNYDRDIVNATDDSVVQIVNNDTQILRLSRGYCPKEIKLPFKIDKKILAFGANSKNNIAIAFDNKIIISPYIGDISNIKNINFLNQTIKTFERFYDFRPDVILCDKHPEYETTKLAKKMADKKSIKLVQIQHHIAHIYSTKAEYYLKDKYTSFIFDGTGYGDDKNLWGGEVFIGDKREYHFKYIKLLGGSKAIKEPKRVALSMLFDRYSLEDILAFDIPFLKEFSKNEILIFYQSYIKNINTPLSSSVGRLFDAIASFADICHIQTYEGEAGLLTQIKATDISMDKSFDYVIDGKTIDIGFDFFDSDLINRFYSTLVKIILDISIKTENEIILSGGVFQNNTLLLAIIKELKNNGIKYHYNKTVPINDGGICAGQILYFLTHYYSTD